MITDINCWYGDWPFSKTDGGLAKTVVRLEKYGVGRIYISPLAAVFCRNQQAYNDELLKKTKPFRNVFPVPMIDPTLPTWEDEFRRMRAHPRVRMFRAVPGYARCSVESMKSLCKACAEADIPLLVQCRIEDSRSRHPLTVAVNEPGVKELLEMKKDLPALKMIAAGLAAYPVFAEAQKVLACHGLYIDTSMLDGMDVIEALMSKGLKGRLLFGSNAPLLETCSAVAKIAWVRAHDAEMIFQTNAERIGL